MIQNNEIIIYNECTNSGNRIYTYYNDVIGAMEAYGYSAYLAAKLVKGVLCLWSDDMQMPCAVLRKQQMDDMSKMGEVEVQDSSVESLILSLSAPVAYNKEGYDQWLGVLKARKQKVASPLPVEEGPDGYNSEPRVDSRANGHFFGSHIKNETVVTIIAMLFSLLVAGLIYTYTK